MIKNIPDIKMGIVMSSRNNFSEKLAKKTGEIIQNHLTKEHIDFSYCPLMTEKEQDVCDILDFLKEEKCNSLVIILGNFGSETAETILAQRFGGPVMFAGVTEDGDERMYDGRRDSYCGMLNCFYNLGIRNRRAYVPLHPIGTVHEIVKNMKQFFPFARAIVGLQHLKIITFGPRPNDFVACNAPIKGLYDLNIEIQENSELDLYLAFQKHKDDPRIPKLVEEMIRETGSRKYIDTLPAMAQYELTLLDWAEAEKGAQKYVAFANKCWPAFQQVFGFLPCYVHGRMGAVGIPVACEVDVYGALSEYIGLCVSQTPVTLMDINNTVPDDIHEKICRTGYNYRQGELFMAFHCGNTSLPMLVNPVLKYKLNRKDPYAPETGQELTRGTFEGRIIPGLSTVFRLHGRPDGSLQAYVVKGEILPTEVNTYGNYGILAVRDMERFYRYVLLAKQYPHHAAVVFGDHAAAIYEVLEYLGVKDISYNQPESILYAHENPFYGEES